jgi:tetratricopeptide (TPR) repeat protein
MLLPIDLRVASATCAAALLLTTASPARALDVDALWDFGKPALSEERFRAALAGAQGDDVLILKTQIARTWGLRRDFPKALQVLAEVEPQLGQAGPEARTRYFLEVGRTFASGTHDLDKLSPHAKAMARDAYNRALTIAQKAGLDALAIDAVHMFAFVDTDPEDGIRWADEGLKIVRASKQPAAKGWEASLRNNRGYALQRLGRYDEALADFRLALAVREQQGRPRGIRIAHWRIAHTLRLMQRLDEAREIQLRLEREWDADGQPDPYVFEELEAIYKAEGNAERAAHYAARLKASRGS